MFKLLGVWRSLVARFVRDEEVAGSNPVTPTMCDVPRHMSAYVAGFFGFLGWVFRVICPFWVWGVSGHLSVFWLVGFVGVDGVFGDDFSGVFVDDYGVWSVY